MPKLPTSNFILFFPHQTKKKKFQKILSSPNSRHLDLSVSVRYYLLSFSGSSFPSIQPPRNGTNTMASISPQNLLRFKPLSDPSLSNSPPVVPSRKSDRKRKSREFPDASPTFKIPPASAAGGPHKSWTENEEVALLRDAVRFRAQTGSAPRTPDMEEFFESVKRSLGSGMDQVRVFYKLKRLKSKFLQTSGPLGGPHERLLYKLSAEVWGSEATAKHERELEEKTNCEEEGEMENGRVNCAFVEDALRKYWGENERMNYSGALLEEGLRSMDPAQAMKLEMKWREQVESDMRLKMKRHEMCKEVYGLLAQVVKNS